MALRNFVFGLLAVIAGTAFSIPAVAQANRPPTISGVPATSASVGLPYSFQPTASDPDRRQWLRYSISNKPAWASFSSWSGRLTGTPKSHHVGTTTGIVIRVSDGRLSAALAPFSITVSGSSANRAPTIAGTPPGTGAVGSLYSFSPVASDPDGDPLTWSITAKPAAAAFSVSTGQLSWTPTAAGTWSGIVVTVTDSNGASASLPPFTITVPPPAPAGTARLTWQAPTQYTDGSSLPASQLAAFRIYRGTSAAMLSLVAEVDSLAVTFTAQGLANGTHYFAVTAVTVAGVESARSVTGSKTIP